ncbi:hypothetical protein L210DRAFT_3591477 [Boletus edulis BED1]|uniref:Uncharacterized protein n=1 Tax=Boletus edulis BED1 TaxID=1328754 RepID=A0AAD4BA94_BOLED|nr:hypothetical protein L210DRAFT_3591477 [Boletus edulis BED1]
MISALNGSSFVPGPVETCKDIVYHNIKMKRGYFKGKVVYFTWTWSFVVFLSAADLVIILRVYAMWNRSRTILYGLLIIYVLQFITTVIFYGIYDNPNTHLSITVMRIVDFSVCFGSFVDFPLVAIMIILVPRCVLAVTLLILAVFQTVKQSFQMYRATKQWQPNRYMHQLAGDGILYFFASIVVDIVGAFGGVPANAGNSLDASLSILFYTLIPRFIISIRELYDRDTRGRLHVDTGFGVVSRSNADPDTTMSAMVFVDGNHGPGMEGGADNLGDLEMDRRVTGQL